MARDWGEITRVSPDGAPTFPPISCRGGCVGEGASRGNPWPGASQTRLPGPDRTALPTGSCEPQGPRPGLRKFPPPSAKTKQNRKEKKNRCKLAPLAALPHPARVFKNSFRFLVKIRAISLRQLLPAASGLQQVGAPALPRIPESRRVNSRKQESEFRGRGARAQGRGVRPGSGVVTQEVAGGLFGFFKSQTRTGMPASTAGAAPRCWDGEVGADFEPVPAGPAARCSRRAGGGAARRPGQGSARADGRRRLPVLVPPAPGWRAEKGGPSVQAAASPNR